MSELKGKFCTICGNHMIQGSEVSRGFHQRCQSKHCTLCGKQTESTVGMYGLIVCTVECYVKHNDIHNDKVLGPIRAKFPNIHQNDLDWIVSALDDDEHGEFDFKQFKKDIKGDRVLLLFQDSDNRRSYELIPAKMDVIDYAVETRHRNSIGCNCNEYIDGIIYLGQSYSHGEAGNGIDIGETPSDGAIYSAVSKRNMTEEQHEALEKSIDVVIKGLSNDNE